MTNVRQPYLMTENLGYTLNSTQTIFEGMHLSLSMGDRIALVGANGVGKSTLLKMLAGQIQPTQGSVARVGVAYYLPQISTIRESIQSESVLEFLNAISNEWWEIEQILVASFSTVLDLALPMQDLSGGELAQLFLAVGLSRSPDHLFLDEPTNHLDYLALEKLRQVICQFQGGCIMVSHKPLFLDQVAQTIWELTSRGINVYGGNFSDYRAQKQLEDAAKVRSHETARKELKRTKAAALQEQQRAAQSSREGRKRALSGGLPRAVIGGRKRRAENTAAKLKTKHDQAIANATQSVAESKVRTHRTTSIQLQESSPKHRTLIEVSHANLWVEDRLLLQDIGLQVSSCDRISLIGPNGSGKSCLIKALLSGDSPARLNGGVVKRAEMRTVYLDQNYASVDRSLTILENLQRANPDLNYQLLRQQLGHFLFFGDDVYKSASVLSGGELARVAISMITISAIDLLILDEPTNNLDIATLDQMVETLNVYQGALLVISHDLDFLCRIQITHSFQLKDQALQQTIALPSERSDYHTHLLTGE